MECSPEKAGVGGSTPSRGTIKSTTYKPQELETCSNLFQNNSNPGPAEVCLIHESVAAVAHDFASFLKTHFAQEIARDARAFKKLVLRLIRRELPPRCGRPNDPRIDSAVRMVEKQGKSVKEVLRSQIPNFDCMDAYARYLAEKGLRTAVARRKKRFSKSRAKEGPVGPMVSVRPEA